MTLIGNSTSAFFERSLSQMSGLRENIERLQTQIATSQRIQRGSEDPVSASRLRALTRLEQRGAIEAENAARLGQDLTQAGEEIEGVVSLLQRARELAIAAANGPTGSNGRAAIAAELEQLEAELFARANASTITGAPLFAGTASAPAFVRDGSGAVIYNGNDQSDTVPVASGTEIERGVTGRQVFEFEVNGAPTSAPTSAFAVITGLASALRGGPADIGAAAAEAIAGLDASLDAANRSQTVIGTRNAWVEAIQIDQQTRAITVAEKRAEIGGTDIADTIVRLQQALTALEASQSSFTRVASLTLFNAL